MKRDSLADELCAAEGRDRDLENERLQALEQSADAIGITDKDGMISYVNTAFEQLTGYSREEVVGKNMRILKSGAQDVEVYSSFWRTIRSGETWTGRFVNRKKDGTIYEEDKRVSPIWIDGEIVGFVSVNRDLTDVRVLEAQLIEARKMEAIGRLAGGIAHDFNNMLTIIIGLSHQLEADIDVRAWRDDVRQVRQAGERAADLTSKLLAFGRKQVLSARVVSLNTIVDQAMQMLQRIIGEDIALTVDLDPRLQAVVADPGQVEQAILNLALNARDSMPHGGTLAIRTANVDRPNEADELVPWASVEVSDTGVGMDADTAARAFEPFFTTKPPGKGTGLGLSTVYGFAKQSGGTVEVRSSPGQGSSFFVLLPLATPADTPLPGERRERRRRGDELVLLIEDEPGVRRLTARLLTERGYRVLQAGDLYEAIAHSAANRGNVRIMLSDVVLPGASGPAIYEALKREQPRMKVLFMSGYPDDRVAGLGVLDGTTAFIAKPFTGDLLGLQVRKVLDRA